MEMQYSQELYPHLGFPGSSVVNYLRDNAVDSGDVVQSLGHEDPLKVEMATRSCILPGKNPMDRGARWVTVHAVAKSQTWLSTHACIPSFRQHMNRRLMAEVAPKDREVQVPHQASQPRSLVLEDEPSECLDLKAR